MTSPRIITIFCSKLTLQGEDQWQVAESCNQLQFHHLHLINNYPQPQHKTCFSAIYHCVIFVIHLHYFFSFTSDYEPTPAPTAPAWQGRSIGTSKLRLVEFSAFLEQQRDPDSVSASDRKCGLHSSSPKYSWSLSQTNVTGILPKKTQKTTVHQSLTVLQKRYLNCSFQLSRINNIQMCAALNFL